MTEASLPIIYKINGRRQIFCKNRFCHLPMNGNEVQTRNPVSVRAAVLLLQGQVVPSVAVPVQGIC